MQVIDFRKERAEQLIRCLESGEPIPPAVAGQWSKDDMLSVAGALMFGAMTHGPSNLVDVLGGTDAACAYINSLHGEHREATEEQCFNDITAAIEAYSQLVMSVKDGHYDESCEPHCLAEATQSGTMERSLKPISGFKR